MKQNDNSPISGNALSGVALSTSTKQPQWKLVANLGDKHPIDYGGYFVFEDATGVYPPEAELLVAPDSESQPESEGPWTVYRFILEPCTFENGILSDNKLHPDKAAWFADSLGSIGNSAGIPVSELVDMLVNGNPQNKAVAWQAIGQYHGFDNLDSYPLTFTDRAEVEARHAKHPYVNAAVV